MARPVVAETRRSRRLPFSRVPLRPRSMASLRLFNGKDLTGWKTNPRRPGNWRVENGVLIGSGQEVGNLYSERGDYKNFHVLIEARHQSRRQQRSFFPVTFGGSWNQEYRLC